MNNFFNQKGDENVDDNLNAHYLQKMSYLKYSKSTLIEDAKQKDGIDNVDLQDFSHQVLQRTIDINTSQLLKMEQAHAMKQEQDKKQHQAWHNGKIREAIGADADDHEWNASTKRDESDMARTRARMSQSLLVDRPQQAAPAFQHNSRNQKEQANRPQSHERVGLVSRTALHQQKVNKRI